MNSRFQTLYSRFREGELTRLDLARELETAGDFTADLLVAIEDSLARKDLKSLPALVGVIYLIPSSKFTQLLCDLLDNHRDTAYLHDIAWLAADIRDEQMVPSLIRALGFIDPEDPDYHFNRNLLAALDAIGTPEAIEAIKLAAQSLYEPIREEAEGYLRKRRLVE